MYYYFLLSIKIHTSKQLIFFLNRPTGVCPLVGEIGPEACVGFLVGETGTCALVGGTGSCPSGGQGHGGSLKN